MAASVHKLQLVHSATSMIMFHFFIVDLASLQKSARARRDPQAASRAERPSLRYLRHHQLKELERSACLDGRGLGRPEINAPALPDFIVAVVEADASLALHHVDELMLVRGSRRKGLRRLQP